MKLLDLFSGIGGFSLGLERAGFETVAFCEIDKKAQKVLKKHWPHVPIFSDVTTLSKEKLDERGISVDAICGGFPCQDISIAGDGAGIEGKRSGLWSEYARLIGELRPKYAIVENVAALLHRGLDRVLGDLAEIGYDAEWHCIPASAVGAPHRRDRIWIVAHPRYRSWRNVGAAEERSEHESQRTANPSEIGGSGQQSEIVAHANCQWKQQSTRHQQKSRGWIGNGGENMAYPVLTRWQGRIYWRKGEEWEDQFRYFGRSSASNGQSGENWWTVEPDVGRVAHGVSGRVDRLKQLGNAVVPQIPELIGRAIMDSNKKLD